MKKVAMVIALNGFRDEEYLVPKQIFEQHNINVVTVSTDYGTARGKLGHMCGVDVSIDDLKESEFDAIVFVGGPGTPEVRSHKRTEELVLAFHNNGKTIGAICWAVTILAKAGILKGRKATLWVGHDPEFKMTTTQYLLLNGGTHVQQGVIQDGRIITADGPGSAREFGLTVAKEILKK